MNTRIQMTSVTPHHGCMLLVKFSDDSEGIVDLFSTLVSGPDPLRALLLDPDRFRKAFIDGGTVAWPGDLDLSVEYVYALLHGLLPPETYEHAKGNELEVSLREVRALSKENRAIEQIAGYDMISRFEAIGLYERLNTLRQYLAILGWDLEVAAVQGEKRVLLRGL